MNKPSFDQVDFGDEPLIATELLARLLVAASIYESSRRGECREINEAAGQTLVCVQRDVMLHQADGTALFPPVPPSPFPCASDLVQVQPLPQPVVAGYVYAPYTALFDGPVFHDCNFLSNSDYALEVEP